MLDRCPNCGRQRTERYGTTTGRCRHCVHERDTLGCFQSHYIVDISGCWEWTAYRNAHGYGEMRVRGKKQKAHRIGYELLVGPIPAGLTIDHLCRNRGCVNPQHLEPVTRRENVLRGVSLPAAQAAQTHCKRGHEFTAENTYRSAKRPRMRICRTCARQQNQARRQQRRTTLKQEAV